MTTTAPVQDGGGEAPKSAPARVAVLIIDTQAEREAVVAHLRDARIEHRADADYELWHLTGADDWDVVVVVAGTREREARVMCNDAIEALDPALLMFVGVALPANGAVVGDVIAAERISRVYKPRRRGARRPVTRSASDYDLIRHAARACDEGSWTERVRLDTELVGTAGLGHVVTGHIPSRSGRRSRSLLKVGLADAAALVPDRWGHVPALYADDNLPAMAFCAVRDDLDADEASRVAAADHASALALAVLASDPVAAADTLESVLDDGLEQHEQTDLESPPIERREGFLQPRFLIDADRVAGAPRRAGNGHKERLGRGRVGALMQTVGSPKHAIPPPDVEISIELCDGKLDFFLSVADEHPGLLAYRHKRMGSTPLGGEFGDTPEKYRENLMRQIRKIAAEPERGDERLETLGCHVFDDLFPDLLKREYENFRDKITTLWVTSDEPWIPWELVRPYSQEHGRYDDFLAGAFHLTRWHGDIEPKPRFEVSHIALIEAGTVDDEPSLQSAAAECRHLALLARKHAVCDLSPERANPASIRTLLRRDEDIQLWHVAAHGRPNAQDPERSAIVLHGGRWESAEIAGRDRTEIGKARPLVFFNACLVARQDFTLGKLAGWPAAWLKSNCGAFLGPQWSVDSDLAATFSKTFYDALAGGDKLGMAASKARAEVRKVAPTDPAWLSYAVYGNPNAEVEFVAAAEEDPT
jgi:hypothetical protein